VKVKDKVLLFWYALRDGVVYPVLTKEIDGQEWRVWRVWNIRKRINKYVVSNTSGVPFEDGGKSIVDAIVRKIEEQERVVSQTDEYFATRRLNHLRQLLAYAQEK